MSLASRRGNQYSTAALREERAREAIMKGISKGLCALVLSLVVISPACAPPGGSGEAGAINLGLQVGGGVQLDAVAFDVSGNGFHKTGSLPVAGSSTVAGRIDGIPPGVGFLLALSATDARDPRTRCQGSATFDIRAG